MPVTKNNVIIAGSRGFTDYDSLCKAMKNIEPTAIISGTAVGADQLGERWAIEHNIELIKMPANWSAYGKSAGMERNGRMALIADTLVALWDGMAIAKELRI
jgi:hypothetical protein